MSHTNCNSRKASKRALNGAHRMGAPRGRVAEYRHGEPVAPSLGARAMAIAYSVMRSVSRGKR